MLQKWPRVTNELISLPPCHAAELVHFRSEQINNEIKSIFIVHLCSQSHYQNVKWLISTRDEMKIKQMKIADEAGEYTAMSSSRRQQQNSIQTCFAQQ